MKLLIISHTNHYRSTDGDIVGWGPTVRENDYIASLFNEVKVIGYLFKEEAPASTLPYTSKNIKLIPVPPVGGSGVINKLKVALQSLYYLYVIHKAVSQLNRDDWIYVRCPCNIGLLACLYLSLRKRPRRWFKFAGNWMPTGESPLSYRIQRDLLKNNHCGGSVTINGIWPRQPSHVFSFLNPCISDEEYQAAMNQIQEKPMGPPYTLLFVGRIEKEKGVDIIFHIAKQLKQQLIPFELILIGDNPEASHYNITRQEMGLEEHVTFLDPMTQSDLHAYYQRAHIFLLPSFSEGWPKVLSEAMNYGCVPVASRVSSIPQIIEKHHCGATLPIDNIDEWVKEVRKLIDDQEYWKELSSAARNAARFFTYEAMVKELQEKILV
ncbi:MAG: glycosyltransferase family 4 protein [Fibrobacteria bacterium]|nr:glycosyltransferase family 4 protein [Fibrobacteria bacterium]